MYFWRRDTIISIDYSKRDAAKLREAQWFIPEWRTASAAKGSKPVSRIVPRYDCVRVANYKMCGLNQAPR